MRIGFLIYSLHGGGAERVVATLANFLAVQGHDIYIILFDDSDRAFQISELVNIIGVSKIQKMNKLYRIYKRCSFIRSEIKKNKIEVLYAFMDGAVPYAVLSTVGISTKVIGAERTNPKILSIALRGIIYSFSAFCSGYVFQTEGAKKCYPAVTRRKAAVIGNPLHNDVVKWSQSASYDFCSVGRLHPAKDFLTLLKAGKLVLEEIPDFTLSIYGDGPLRSKMERFIEENGLKEHVFLKGFVKDVSRQIAQYGAFVFSSRAEGMPNALLEAMAAGMPCISSDCEFGPGELIDSGNNGYLVPVGDVEKLANAIVRFCQEPELRIRMGAAAGKIAKEYSAEKICSQYLNYAQLVKDMR